MTDDSGIPGLGAYAILDKPTGLTSFALLSQVSRLLGPRIKAGHAGTLDSFASGVLVCLFGRYTRLSDYFMGTSKTYEALIGFGTETDTLDPEGRVIAQSSIPSREVLESVLPGFIGEILQVPPVYSALHVDGERAYERVRKGQTVLLPPRPVTIYRLELLSFIEGRAHIVVTCSKGTYIRSLARDLALACGARAHLLELRRTTSGPFTLADSVKPSDFNASKLQILDQRSTTGLGLGCIELQHDEARAFSNGLPLNRIPAFSELSGSQPVAVFDSLSNFLGIASPKPSSLKGWEYDFVLERPR